MTSSGTNPNLVDSAQIDGSDVQIPAGGAQLNAYLTRPAGVSSAPGVIVIHENRGLVPYTRAVADGLASAGYVAVAPDLLSRDGGTAAIPDVPSALQGIPRERHIGDVQATFQYLKGQPGVTKIGIIGFCFGGGITWHFATANAELAAAVPFYGSNPPMERVPSINAAVYAVYGELDERINAGIPAITDAMKAENKAFEMKVYPNAPHAFHNHTSAERYREPAAKAAWSDALAWFDRYLRG